MFALLHIAERVSAEFNDGGLGGDVLILFEFEVILTAGNVH